MRQWLTRLVAALATVAAAAVVAAPAALAQSPAPYGQNDAGGFLNILPAGEGGLDNAVQLAEFEATGAIPSSFEDQLPMYENLEYAAPTLTDGQVSDYFKDATFGVEPQNIVGTESPEPGLTIVRDNYDVPHVYGQTRAETMFGAGYAGAEDRLFLMDVLRHYAEGQLASFAGGSRSNRQMDETQWSVAPYSEQDLQSQIDNAQTDCSAEANAAQFPASQCPATVSQLLSDVGNYVAGINAYIDATKLNPLLLPSEYVALGTTPQPWKETDVVAVASLIGGIFGLGGGGQVNSALALQALEQRFGHISGERAWSDFREANDPETPLTILHKSFPYENTGAFGKRGLALPDPGSVSFPPIGTPAASSSARTATKGFLANIGAELHAAFSTPAHASNWELVSAKHSATGHPLAVMGPQVGYYVPEILMEEDLHGPGIDARGAAFPGVNLYVELGHGRDYAWSATTSTSDNVSTFAEVLCQDAYHYLYRGQCIPMQKLVDVDSWHPTLADSTPAGTETLVAYRTVHGIVYARGKVHGRPVAFVHARSTYFHEVDSAIGFSELNDPDYIDSPSSFQHAVAKINFLFNWAYVDASHISYYMSGWMPQLAKGVSPDFPILGTGKYDWKGWNPSTHLANWLPYTAHPHITDQDYLVSWNNKQAPGWSAADNQWAYGPVFRQEMIANHVRADIAHGHKMTISQLVQAMDLPSTEDIEAIDLPLLFKALGTPRNPALRSAIAELRGWYYAGAYRRAASLATAAHDLYTPSIELMDAWWPKLVTAEFEPMLGQNAFKAIQMMLPIGGEAPVSGDGFTDGWWGYVSKDLRREFGGSERARYSQAYCGNLPHHHLKAATLRRRCRAALRASLSQALSVTPKQLYGGVCPSDPEPACADRNTWSEASAIVLPAFPFQNRPTFQQVVTLTQHLPR
jgi:acyl-homoserine lactone acylase PvdQ